MPDYLAIATWRFGQTAVKAAASFLEEGKSALDAAIAGAQAVEDDPTVDSVGYGGMPNAIGTVSLDACVMDGHSLDCGSVAGVENIRHVAELARRVMKTPHICLVGQGAQQFALKNGMPLENLNTATTLTKWEKNKPAGKPPPPPMPSDSHDTVVVLTRDKNGSLAGACSTSGLPYKLPGRVGDSPIIGAGLYVDNTAGGAGGTGVGEEIIRIGGSLLIVEAMRSGKSAQKACELAIRKINTIAARRGVHPARVAFLAMDKDGNPGAASTERTKFEYAIARPGKVELVKAKEIGAA
jgi:isoaspartyl peptidase/L-asparaginase-like protein (Ntn-hydrolase superfamily)